MKSRKRTVCFLSLPSFLAQAQSVIATNETMTKDELEQFEQKMKDKNELYESNQQKAEEMKSMSKPRIPKALRKKMKKEGLQATHKDVQSISFLLFCSSIESEAAPLDLSDNDDLIIEETNKGV